MRLGFLACIIFLILLKSLTCSENCALCVIGLYFSSPWTLLLMQATGHCCVCMWQTCIFCTVYTLFLFLMHENPKIHAKKIISRETDKNYVRSRESVSIASKAWVQELSLAEYISCVCVHPTSFAPNRRRSCEQTLLKFWKETLHIVNSIQYKYKLPIQLKDQ